MILLFFFGQQGAEPPEPPESGPVSYPQWQAAVTTCAWLLAIARGTLGR